MATRCGIDVDFFWCHATADPVHGVYHPPTDEARRTFLESNGVNLIEFHVKHRDLGSPKLAWRGTDFWDIFAETSYDLVQTAKSGAAEYPFSEFGARPLVQASTLVDWPDRSSTLAWTFHLSHWAYVQNLRRGGDHRKMSVAPIPTYPSMDSLNLRQELHIPSDATVIGLHQRAADSIFSPIPIQALAAINRQEIHFVSLGGSSKYEEQARDLGIVNFHAIPSNGDRTTISRFLNTLDIYTHGRRDGETFGAAIAEALMHGLPVVTHYSQSGANAHRETLGPGGFFAYSLSEYQDSLLTLIEDPSLRGDLGARGQAHVDKYFSLNAFQDAVAAGYSAAGLESIATALVDPAGNRLEDRRFIAQMPAGYLQIGPTTPNGHIIAFADSGVWPEDFDTYLFSFFVRKGTVILDIGANVGLYTPLALHMNRETYVHAFEPMSSARADLQATIEANGWSSRCTVWPVALGNQTGFVALHLFGTGSTLRPEFNDHESSGVEEVKSVKLDSLVEDGQIGQFQLMKIDVEGWELAVLEGAAASIRRFRPTIFMEVSYRIKNRDFINSQHHQVLRLLEDFDYLVFASDGKRKLKRVTSSFEPSHICMVMAIPVERSSDVRPLMQWVKAFPRGSRTFHVRRKLSQEVATYLGRSRWRFGSMKRLIKYQVSLLMQG